jgi:hypothetical protein
MSIRALSVAVATAITLVPAGVAGASNGRERVVVERFVDEYSFEIDCAEFAPYAFENEVEGTLRVSVTDVLADDGTLLQTVFHFVLNETDTNTVSGKILPLRGGVQEVWDYASNTRTLSGAVYIGTERGGGTYLQDTGRITMTLDTRIAQFVAGPHEGFFAGVDMLVCAALSA